MVPTKTILIMLLLCASIQAQGWNATVSSCKVRIGLYDWQDSTDLCTLPPHAILLGFYAIIDTSIVGDSIKVGVGGSLDENIAPHQFADWSEDTLLAGNRLDGSLFATRQSVAGGFSTDEGTVTTFCEIEENSYTVKGWTQQHRIDFYNIGDSMLVVRDHQEGDYLTSASMSFSSDKVPGNDVHGHLHINDIERIEIGSARTISGITSIGSATAGPAVVHLNVGDEIKWKIQGGTNEITFTMEKASTTLVKVNDLLQYNAGANGATIRVYGNASSGAITFYMIYVTTQ